MLDFLTWVEEPFSQLIQHAFFSVDTFFFLSGLLVSIVAMRLIEKQQGKLNVPFMYLHRYLRLTPVLAMCILVTMKLKKHMTDGPLWHTSYFNNPDDCKSTWYLTLLYVQNYATKDLCIGHSWYLAVDMQLYILSPLLLLALYKWGKKAAAGIVLLMLLLSACLFATILINDYSLFVKHISPEREEAERRTYYPTHVHAAPWLIGLVFGYFLHINRSRKFQLPQITIWLGWLIALALFFASLFSLYPASQMSAPSFPILNEAFYVTLTRIAWPLGLCWLVFACQQGYGGLANSFLSSPLWQPLSKLSYSVYMWHMMIQSINTGRTRTNTFFSDYDVMLRFWADFGFTVLMAFFMYLIVEAPFSGLGSMMLSGSKPGTPPSGPVETKLTGEEASPVNEGPISELVLNKSTSDVEIAATNLIDNPERPATN